MGDFVSSSFAIDSIPGQIFEGYSDGDTWNGWACPYFERAVAEKVLRASEANGYRWQYDSQSDTFIVQSEDDSEDYEPESFRGTQIILEGVELTLYGIGAYSWIWEEATVSM